jgi:hypothetical protein
MQLVGGMWARWTEGHVGRRGHDLHDEAAPIMDGAVRMMKRRL